MGDTIKAAVYRNLHCSECPLYVEFHKGKMHFTVQIVFTLCDRDSGGSIQRVARIMKDRQNFIQKAGKFFANVIHICENEKSDIFSYLSFSKDGAILLLCYFHYPSEQEMVLFSNHCASWQTLFITYTNFTLMSLDVSFSLIQHSIFIIQNE